MQSITDRRRGMFCAKMSDMAESDRLRGDYIDEYDRGSGRKLGDRQ